MKLYLITTGTAAEKSAASLLRASERDVATAQQTLDSTARTSKNKSNLKAYKEYLKATPKERTDVLNTITVIDAASDITDLEEELHQELFWAVDKNHRTAFLDRLEGWWFRRVLKQLESDSARRIGSVELDGFMSDLREQFKREALPIDEDLLSFTLDDATWESHQSRNFVRQLGLINAGKRRVASSIRDYYRAFVQRSRWVRLELVVDLDLAKYEKRLIEEWGLVFDSVRDEIGDEATEEEQQVAARSILTWAERTPIPIRPNVTEPFVSRGSFHILADDVRIGWHPDFRNRLEALLGLGEST
ncbi:MAG: ABC-three component system protein [Acidobacteriota bacterium]